LLIYDVIQCCGFDGDCDNHATGKIQREAYRPMERIGGFMRSHFIASSGVCSRRIGPADAMVIAVAVV
jgi:hypothetical protein